jgi:hypothetical protein
MGITLGVINISTAQGFWQGDRPTPHPGQLQNVNAHRDAAAHMTSTRKVHMQRAKASMRHMCLYRQASGPTTHHSTTAG